MPSIWKTLAAVSTLGLALVVWGCEQPTELDNPSPQIEAQSSGLMGLGDIAGFNSVASTVGATVAGAVRATVGAQGGALELGGHVLTVPPGSVHGLTTFTMRQVPNGGIEVELQATSPGGRANDVGSQGFDRPVRLVLSYAGTDVDPEDLVIVRVDDGQPQETHVSTDGSSTVWADLRGFSRYRLCSN